MEISIAQPENIQYGDCSCGGVFINRFVEVRIHQTDGTVVIRNVPQGACSNCGSRVYKTGILQRIEYFYREYSNQ